jgi:outer membrane biosynthesis protein TonB
VYFVMPTRPADIDLAASRAVVTLRLTLDGAGSVSEIRSGLGGLVTVANGLAASDAFIEAAADAVRQWRYEPPADPPISFDVRIAFAPDGTSSLVMHGGMALLPMAPLPPPPPPPLSELSSAPWAEGAVRVGGGVRPPIKIRNVPPAYPPEALSARLQGVVILGAAVPVLMTVTVQFTLPG